MTPDVFLYAHLGQPWQSGASGPDVFDCWGLVRAWYREVRGIDLPVVDVDALQPLAVRHAFADGARSWKQVDAPADGDAVLMSKASQPSHVGVWMNGAVLHCTEASGVVYQRPLSLRLVGWNVLGYYRRAG